ncbi:MAG: hypothetical protein ACI845_004392 [Gammaproteobacteria bacterium]|jgi:hypothetical protein
MDQNNEQAEIEAVVVEYLEGMIYGQPDRLEGAMHPLCKQAGHFNGQYEFYGRDEFIQALKLEVMLPPGTPYQSEIISIDITGDVAVVKVKDDCFDTTFTDYLTMIKSKGRWQIVMKAFFDHAND